MKNKEPDDLQETVDRHFALQEGRYWALCIILGTVIQESGISQSVLAKHIEKARMMYPGTVVQDHIKQGFDEAVKHVIAWSKLKVH